MLFVKMGATKAILRTYILHNVLGEFRRIFLASDLF